MLMVFTGAASGFRLLNPIGVSLLTSLFSPLYFGITTNWGEGLFPSKLFLSLNQWMNQWMDGYTKSSFFSGCRNYSCLTWTYQVSLFVSACTRFVEASKSAKLPWMHWYRAAAVASVKRVSLTERRKQRSVNSREALTLVSNFYFLPRSRIWCLRLVSRTMTSDSYRVCWDSEMKLSTCWGPQTMLSAANCGTGLSLLATFADRDKHCAP